MRIIHCVAVICLCQAGLPGVLAADAPPLGIRSLAKGAFSGIAEPRREIIRSADEWEKLWRQHGSARAGAAAPAPAVDFSKEMVIVATLGTRPTGGYAIEIVRVVAADKTLKVFVNQTSPPPGAMAIQALTAPFHYVAVPRSDLKAEFVNAGPDKK